MSKGIDIMNEVAKRIQQGPQEQEKMCECDCEACCQAHGKQPQEKQESEPSGQ